MTTLRLQPRPSGQFALLLIALHVISAMALCVSSIHVTLKVVVLFAVVISIYYHFGEHVFRSRTSAVVEVVVATSRRAMTIDRGGRNEYWQIQDESVWNEWFVVLSLRSTEAPGKTRRVFLSASMLSDFEYRRLCAALISRD